jgi:hypothetical protein
MVKWEYAVVFLGRENHGEMLNQKGNQGWELVQVKGDIGYFKRVLNKVN